MFIPTLPAAWSLTFLYLEADIFSLEMGAGREVVGPGRVTLPLSDAAGLVRVFNLRLLMSVFPQKSWVDCHVTLAWTTSWKVCCAIAKHTSMVSSTQVKQMAAVLLRRLLSSSFEEIYPSLTLEMQTAIKTELLTSIQHETSLNIRKKVCDIAAELSRNLIGNDPAPFFSTSWLNIMFSIIVYSCFWDSYQMVV